MRVHADNKPTVNFSYSYIPNHPDMVLVRFYENAQTYTEQRDDITISGWVYDEYHLELPNTGNLQADIEGNFDLYLASAKATEEPTQQELDRADIDFLMAMGGYIV